MTAAHAPQAQPGPRRLVRDRDDRMLGGVCAGLATYLGVGTVACVYLVAWVMIPQR